MSLESIQLEDDFLRRLGVASNCEVLVEGQLAYFASGSSFECARAETFLRPFLVESGVADGNKVDEIDGINYIFVEKEKQKNLPPHVLNDVAEKHGVLAFFDDGATLAGVDDNVRLNIACWDVDKQTAAMDLLKELQEMEPPPAPEEAWKEDQTWEEDKGEQNWAQDDWKNEDWKKEDQKKDQWKKDDWKKDEWKKDDQKHDQWKKDDWKKDDQNKDQWKKDDWKKDEWGGNDKKRKWDDSMEWGQNKQPKNTWEEDKGGWGKAKGEWGGGDKASWDQKDPKKDWGKDTGGEKWGSQQNSKQSSWENKLWKKEETKSWDQKGQKWGQDAQNDWKKDEWKGKKEDTNGKSWEEKNPQKKLWETDNKWDKKAWGSAQQQETSWGGSSSSQKEKRPQQWEAQEENKRWRPDPAATKSRPPWQRQQGPKEILETLPSYPNSIDEWQSLQHTVWKDAKPLPAGWIRVWSKRHECAYYLRLEDNHATFEQSEVF